MGRAWGYTEPHPSPTQQTYLSASVGILPTLCVFPRFERFVPRLCPLNVPKVGSDRLNVPAIDNSSHSSSSTAMSNQCTCPLLGWGAPLCNVQ